MWRGESCCAIDDPAPFRPDRGGSAPVGGAQAPWWRSERQLVVRLPGRVRPVRAPHQHGADRLGSTTPPPPNAARSPERRQRRQSPRRHQVEDANRIAGTEVAPVARGSRGGVSPRAPASKAEGNPRPAVTPKLEVRPA